MASRRKSPSTPISLFSFQDIITAVTGIMILIVLLLILDMITRVTDERAKAEAAESMASDPNAEKRTALEAGYEELERLLEEVERLRAILDEASNASTGSVAEQLATFDGTIESLRRAMARVEKQRRDLEAKKKALPEVVRRHLEQAEALKSLAREQKAASRLLDDLKGGKRVLYTPAVRSSKLAILVEVSDRYIRCQPIDRSEKPQLFEDADRSDRLRRLKKWMATRNAEREYFLLLVKPSSAKIVWTIRSACRAKGYDVGMEPLEEDKEAIVKGPQP